MFIFIKWSFNGVNVFRLINEKLHKEGQTLFV